MTKMNYSGNHSRYIPSLTENEKYDPELAYKAHLNGPVTVIKADGTRTIEKRLTDNQINRVTLDNQQLKKHGLRKNKIDAPPKIGTKAHKRMMKKQKMDEGNRRAQNLKNSTPTVPKQIN
jgi:hypothetical protein